MHEIFLVCSLKWSQFAPFKHFVAVLMHVLLWFVAGEANAVLVKARAKAEAIQLLAAALAQQVSRGAATTSALALREVTPRPGWHLAYSWTLPGVFKDNK